MTKPTDDLAGRLRTLDSVALHALSLPLGIELPLPISVAAQKIVAPVIEVEAGHPDKAADAAAAALISSEVPIFVRGGKLVRPSMEVVAAADDTATVTAKFTEVCQVAMVYILAQHMSFQRFDKRSEELVAIDPPEKIAKMLVARAGPWDFPQVAGIIAAPTLRPDGSLLSTPGYDPATRLYLVEDPNLAMPEIPEAPTRDDAVAALALLAGLLEEFPFVGPTDRAVALAGILTAVARPGLRAAPMVAVRANTAGTGKSYLVDCVSAIAIGRRCPVVAAGRTEEETEKRLGAMLLSGTPIVSIDNVNGELGGEALCLMTERPVVRVRVLGKSEMVDIETMAAVFATGNNITLLADMTRRVIMCILDAGVERPEIRTFNKKPVELVLQDRGSYLAAALTILRAYRVAGRPNLCPPLASYEQWSDNVRSALVWLGEPDPVSTMEKAREGDPEAQAIRQLYAHWRDVLGMNSGYTSVQVIAQATAQDFGPSGGDFLHEEFRDLLMRQAGEGRAVSTRRLGKWLAKVAGRVFDGVRLEVRVDPSNGNKYRLCRVENGSGRDDAGTSNTRGAEHHSQGDLGLLSVATAEAYRRASRGE
ncbi:hypothetical protein PUR21_21645 [Methylorubrum rhodesianum]|uniref:DNA primase/helicase n=1 Tax=Methylorubrum rhodesianum TaxID=29427 RepID=A0ABU9ZFH7_9HYPH